MEREQRKELEGGERRGKMMVLYYKFKEKNPKKYMLGVLFQWLCSPRSRV